jgi:hypothetical protein
MRHDHKNGRQIRNSRGPEMAQKRGVVIDFTCSRKHNFAEILNFAAMHTRLTTGISMWGLLRILSAPWERMDNVDNDDRWTFDRVRRRLNTVIENMPARGADIYSDTLLKSLTEDLIQIREALRFFSQTKFRASDS